MKKGTLKDQMTPAEFREFLAKRDAGRDSKFGAIPTTTADGSKFKSIWEAEFYNDQWALQRIGEVALIEREVRYELIVNGVFICAYHLDFRITYTERSPHWGKYPGNVRYVDTKSSATVTQLFRVKQQLMLALFGIRVEAVFDPSVKKK